MTTAYALATVAKMTPSRSQIKGCMYSNDASCGGTVIDRRPGGSETDILQVLLSVLYHSKK